MNNKGEELDYIYIRAYGRIYAISAESTEASIKQAKKDNAPQDAITYSFAKDGWLCKSEYNESDEFAKNLEDVANQIRAG